MELKKIKEKQALLSPAEVAKRIGVSPITVRSWVTKGWLKAHLTPGGHRRFQWEDVERLMMERQLQEDEVLQLKILVVDDEPGFRGYLFHALESMIPESLIKEAADGFEAGLAMAEFQPDLVLLDYAMPGMNGAAVCRLIKTNEAYTNTRVVAITGHADSRVERTLKEAGADLVLFKPLPLKKIEEMLEALDLIETS